MSYLESFCAHTDFHGHESWKTVTTAALPHPGLPSRKTRPDRGMPIQIAKAETSAAQNALLIWMESDLLVLWVKVFLVPSGAHHWSCAEGSWIPRDSGDLRFNTRMKFIVGATSH